MNAVHRVAIQNFLHPGGNAVPHVRAGGVQVLAPGRLLHPLRVCGGQAVGAEGAGHGVVQRQPVGVQPGLQPKAAGVGLLHQNGQRVKAGVAALGASADAGVQGVPEGPHLGENGVQPHGGVLVKPAAHLGTEGGLAGEVGALPLQIADPDGAVFLPGGLGRGRGRGLHIGGRAGQRGGAARGGPGCAACKGQAQRGTEGGKAQKVFHGRISL